MPPSSPTGDPYPDLVAPVQLVELASGVDSLYLSGWAELSGRLLERLDTAKRRAQAVDGEVPFFFGGVEFGLSPYGLQKYRYRLSHRFGTLGVTPSAVLPPMRFQPRAEFLHGYGVDFAVDAIRGMVESEVGAHRLTVSRVDIFSDWQGWQPTFADEGRFVRRARHLTADKDGESWTGFTIGRRSTGSIGGRIYDKTAEIAEKSNPMWFDIWAERYVPGLPVIRAEIEFHRKALSEGFGLDTPGEVLADLPGLWGYATDEWLTHRVPSADSTRSRWEISQPWLAIQQPSFRSHAIGLERSTGRLAEAKLEKILPVLRGCFTSASAQWGVDGMVEALDQFGSYLRSWEAATGHTIDGEIAAKRQRRGWGL